MVPFVNSAKLDIEFCISLLKICNPSSSIDCQMHFLNCFWKDLHILRLKQSWREVVRGCVISHTYFFKIFYCFSFILFLISLISFLLLLIFFVFYQTCPTSLKVSEKLMKIMVY